MKLHNVKQGAAEWHALRSAPNTFTASEASAMMGASKYQSRTELLAQKHTGVTPEVDAVTQSRFQAGHDTEAMFLPFAEKLIGDELSPVTGTIELDGLILLASFDGLTFDRSTAYEHKLFNANIAREIEVMGEPGLHYVWQMEHQLLVCGGQRVLFATSKGTEEGAVTCFYESKPERRLQLIAGWKQFAKDLAEFVPPAPDAPVPTGKAPETLPALHIVLKGEVSASNLDDFKEVALAAIRSVNRDLQTDQDFADSAKARRWCEDIETKVAAAKQHALSQTESIDALFRALDEISDEAAKVRKELKKLEDARTLGINGEVVADGVKQFGDHMRALNAAMPAPYMPVIPADFGGAIKNLRTVASKKNAVATELARAKIAANEVSTRIQGNLRALEQHKEHALLFPDVGVLVLKQPDDLAAVIAQRIAAHEADSKRKADADEAQRKADEAIKTAATMPPTVTPVAAPAVQAASTNVLGVGVPLRTRAPAPEPVAEEKPTMKLGDINARLAGIQVTAEFLAELGFVAHVERSSKLYKPSDFPRICDALIQHLTTVADGVVA